MADENKISDEPEMPLDAYERLQLQVVTIDDVFVQDIKDLFGKIGEFASFKTVGGNKDDTNNNDGTKSKHNAFCIYYKNIQHTIHAWRCLSGYKIDGIKLGVKLVDVEISRQREVANDKWRKDGMPKDPKLYEIRQVNGACGNRVIFDNIPLDTPMADVRKKAELMGKIESINRAFLADHMECVVVFADQMWKHNK